jgi:hypothetical protein
MREFAAAVAVLLISGTLISVGAQVPGVPALAEITGKDLYEQCNSPATTAILACGEYLRGLLDGVIIAQPGSPQLLCPSPTLALSFRQLQTIYVNWAKANPDHLTSAVEIAAVSALLDAFPCRE